MAVAAWEYLHALAKYDGAENAHELVMQTLKARGHEIKKSDAWCSETQMAALYDCGAIDLIGGYSSAAGGIKAKAQKKGIWNNGSSGILPGDIVLFGSNGKPNHTESCVGNLMDVSGNYNGGCSRRSYKGRSIVGYVRPKWAVKSMDNLQVTIAAVDCILGVYGSGSTREKMLSVFGAKNAEKIQDEVDRVWDDMDKILFDMAVYVIAGHAGKGNYRKKRLGNYAERVQDKIDSIDALRSRNIADAAQLVLDEKFGTNAVRRLLLGFCGYDADKVQAAVNEALKEPEKAKSGASGSIISLFRDVPRTTKDVDGLQGNCIIFRSGKSGLIVDTMIKGALEKIKTEISGLDRVEMYISHPHSDHMGNNANSLVKAGLIRKIYLPRRDTIHSDYTARFDTLVKACQKYGVEVVYLRQGDSFLCGDIRGTVIFQQANSSTDSVNMRSLCTLFEIAGTTALYCGDHHCGKKESQFVYVKHVDVYISAHHGLYTGDAEPFIAGISPDWIIHTGWKNWPLGTIGQDAKTKTAQAAYQKHGNLLPGDVCGRTELSVTDGMITAKGEKNMTGKTVRYSLGGKAYQKTVHVCGKAAFVKVQSMIPAGAKFM